MQISASLVLYRNRNELFEAAIASFINGISDGAICVVDNSPEPLISNFFSHPRVKYVFNGKNMGFGAAHNVAINEMCLHSRFHLILNPDIRFDENVVPRLLAVLDNNEKVSALMPRINYPDNSLQKLSKLLPTPVDLFVRRFFPVSSIRNKFNARYELHGLSQNKHSIIPSLSGCFLLCRSELLLHINGFDERYFMYMEDVDLVRRIGEFGCTVYAPDVVVIHEYAKGSYRNKKLLMYHLDSAIKYFNKWGWFFDSKRRKINRETIKNLKDDIESSSFTEQTL